MSLIFIEGEFSLTIEMKFLTKGGYRKDTHRLYFLSTVCVGLKLFRMKTLGAGPLLSFPPGTISPRAGPIEARASFSSGLPSGSLPASGGKGPGRGEQFDLGGTLINVLLLSKYFQFFSRVVCCVNFSSLPIC